MTRIFSASYSPVRRSPKVGGASLVFKRCTLYSEFILFLYFFYPVDGRVPVIPPPLFPNPNQKSTHPVIQLISDPSVSSMMSITQPPKRLKTSSPLTDNYTESNRGLREDSDGTKANIHHSFNKSVNKKSKLSSEKQKQAQSTRTVLRIANRPKCGATEDKKLGEKDDDLMKSYLEARGTEDGCSSQGSLWSAMNSQGW